MRLHPSGENGQRNAAAMADPLAKDNPQQPAGQPTPPAAVRSRWTSAAPWIVLIGWPAVDLAVVVWWAGQDWGFLGDLGLIFALAGKALGYTVWLLVWLVLSDRPLVQRLLYLILGLAALGAVLAPMISWWKEPDLAVALAAIAIGTAMPLVFWRRQGWRFRPAPLFAANGNAAAWQYSIGDLLVLTSGLAGMLGLILIGGPPSPFELVLIATQVLCAVAVAFVCLRWRRFFLACLASLLLVTLACIAGTAIVHFESITEPSSLVLVGFYALPATLSGLAVFGLLRLSGYRLVK